MKTSILLTVFNRPTQLRLSLDTLLRQDLSSLDYEIVVINDGQEDSTKKVIKEYSNLGFPIHYLFTGHRNKSNLIWRVPGFAYNIALQQCTSDIIVLTNTDVLHLNNTLVDIVKATENDPYALGTLNEIYDDTGILIDYLTLQGLAPTKKLDRIIKQIKQIPDFTRDRAPRADPRDPHLLAVRRKHLMDIGGYDEDFTGYACEDTDLMNRLRDYGCYYNYTHGEAIHLFHGVRTTKRIGKQKEYEHNLELLINRQGRCYRNVNKKWGVPSV